MKKIDFFVSYSHDDKNIVDGIVSSLESAGATCGMLQEMLWEDMQRQSLTQ